MNTPPTTPKRKRPNTKAATGIIDHDKSATSANVSKLRPGLEQDVAIGSRQDQPSLQDEQTSRAIAKVSLRNADIGEENAICSSPRAQVANGLGKLVLRGPRVGVEKTNTTLGQTDSTTHLVSANDGDDDAMADDDDDLLASHRKRIRVYSEVLDKSVSKGSDGEMADSKALRQMTPPPEQPLGLQTPSKQQEQLLKSDNGSPEKPTAIPIDEKIDDLPKRNSSKNKINNLTWHDSEITGHLGLDPEDDGTGINGIGFRPTSQQVYARSLRRKQQLRDWRERESREERKRRHDRRAFVGSDTAKPEDGGTKVRRAVHFAW